MMRDVYTQNNVLLEYVLYLRRRWCDSGVSYVIVWVYYCEERGGGVTTGKDGLQI